MQDKSREIFGNKMEESVVSKARHSKKKFEEKFGDDSHADYQVSYKKNAYIGDLLNVSNVLIDGDGDEEIDTENGIIVGNIRMGFGHYRISMAIASAANAMGYKPYWMDLNSYEDTVCTKVISSQNDLYSLGSRISLVSL